jgi:hypothetical protein
MCLFDPLEIFEQSKESIVQDLADMIDQLPDHYWDDDQGDQAVPSRNSDGAGDDADVGRYC